MKSRTTRLAASLLTLLLLLAAAPPRPASGADGPIVFLGDSITEGGHWSKSFPGRNVLNRGVAGETTCDILKRLRRVIQERPSKLFLMAGINDLGAGRRPDRTAVDYEKILTRLMAGTPQTRIYVQSVLPVNNKLFRRQVDNADVIELNRLIAAQARRLGLVYLDLFAIMRTDGRQLDPAFTNDGLHLNHRGYRVWVDFLKPYVTDEKP